MPVLTLEAIRQNPWNVLTHDLPAEPSRLLLNVAQLAAATLPPDRSRPVRRSLR